MERCNLDYLNSITPGSNAFSIQIIEMFLAEAPENINQILNSFNSNDLSELYKNAHKIKPSIEMLGFPSEMKEALLNINVLSKSNSNPEKLSELVQFFISNIDPILKELTLELEALKKS